MADLRDELERVRRTRVRAMRDTHQCPVCGGTRILHFRHVGDTSHTSVVDFTLQKKTWLFWGVKMSAGALEAFACRACRLVEWHAISLDDVEPDGKEVVELAGEVPAPPSSPYR